MLSGEIALKNDHYYYYYSYYDIQILLCFHMQLEMCRLPLWDMLVTFAMPSYYVYYMYYIYV